MDMEHIGASQEDQLRPDQAWATPRKFLPLTTRKLVVWITFLAVFAMAARISVDSDTWWHLRAGQWIVETRSVPQVDPFSHTRAGESWQYPGWLVEVPMYVIYWAFGPGGLNIWTAGMVTLAFWFVWKTLSGGAYLRAFVVILAAAASGVYWAARPYLVTFLFAAMYLWVLETRRQETEDGRRLLSRIWLLPLLMLLWANSHGGFAVGFIIWGVYLTGRLKVEILRFLESRTRNLAAFNFQPDTWALIVTGLAMLIAVCINPSGPVMLLYPFKTVGIEVLQDFIQEWQSPDFHQRQAQPFVWLLLATLGAVGVSKQRISLEDFLLVGGFSYLSFMAGRNIALFALAAPMVLTRHAAPFLEELAERWGIPVSTAPLAPPPRGLTRLNWILLGALILAVGVKTSLVYPQAVNDEHFRDTLPVAAVEFLRAEQSAGNLLNSYNWGGYLLWAAPEYPVFVDGRTDLYGDEVIGEWIQVVQAAPGWENVLAKWDVGVILLEPFRPVVAKLEAAGWQLLYQDEMAVVYGR